MRTDEELRYEAYVALRDTLGSMEEEAFMLMVKRYDFDYTGYKPFTVLRDSLGEADAQRFITITKNDRFDYTKWKQSRPDDGRTLDEVFNEAAEYSKKLRGTAANR